MPTNKEKNMKNSITKNAARELLKNVKSSQWGFVDSDIKGSKVYKTLNYVVKATDKAFFIATPTHPNCKEGFWMPKSVCRFEFKENRSDKNLIEVSIQMPYSFTAQGKDEAKNNFSSANAIANFITKTGGDVYCTQ